VTQFSWPVRVYYEDTDAGGVVYHASYIRFLERARTEWLRSLGVSLHHVVEEQGLLFAVASLEVRYLKPARLDDLLQVRSSVEIAGGASLLFSQDILRGDAEVLTHATVLVACVDAGSLRPRRIPEDLRERFT
jgi:acyl-CoA thioester hydrolase